jgi:hypothetical protein
LASNIKKEVIEVLDYLISFLKKRRKEGPWYAFFNVGP